MKMRMNITIWLAILLVVVSFNTHAAEVAGAGAGAGTGTGTAGAGAGAVGAPDQGAGKGDKDKGDKGAKDSAQSKVEAEEWIAADPWFIYTVIGIVFFASLISLALIRSALSNSKFSLADALSEEANITSLGADGKPVMITELRGSSSRMIALVGMVVILLIFMGFGIFSMYAFAKNGEMPDSQDIVYFLLGGATLFAPYGANQFASLFEKLAPKK